MGSEGEELIAKNILLIAGKPHFRGAILHTTKTKTSTEPNFLFIISFF
jgi:hypothetical protein